MAENHRVKLRNLGLAVCAGFLAAMPVPAQEAPTTNAAPSMVEDEPRLQPDLSPTPVDKVDRHTPPSAGTETTSGKEAPGVERLFPLIGTLGGALIALMSGVVGALLGRMNAVAGNNQRSNELEITQLQAKLNGFYGPFRLISSENLIIAREFKNKQGGGDFRTLLALIDPDWRGRLSASDRTIVEEMVENGKILRALIRDKAGLVDPKIQPYLAKVSAHFSVLEMAYNEGLDNDPDRFRHYVYPQELDGVLEKEFERLSARIEFLFQNSDRKNPPMKPLIVDGAPVEGPKPSTL